MPRHLVLVLGDQLDCQSAAFDGFDRGRDRVWMAEVAEESTHVWTHKARITVFLSAMRHFRAALVADGIDVDYTSLTADEPAGHPGRSPNSLSDALLGSLAKARAAGQSPDRLIIVEPGEWRVRVALEAAAEQAGSLVETDKDSGSVKVTGHPIDRGFVTRLSVGAGALKAAATMAQQQQQGIGGPGLRQVPAERAPAGAR